MSCPCGSCESYAAHMRSIGVATRALVTGNLADRRLERDMKSYKAMVDQGLEPKCMTGAADLEATATSAAEIEGRLDLGNDS